MSQITLQGITWNHTRGFTPMAATAQRWSELHPEIEIAWQKRSLQEFADYPIEKLAEHFDLLVIDHPFAGYAAAHPVLVPLDEHLPAEFLQDQAENSVGASHVSYEYSGHQWALAIDAAAPISARRPDLLEKHNVREPQTWDELLALAQRGLVAVACLPVDALMNFLMLCVALGEAPNDGDSARQFVSPATGLAALEKLRELMAVCDPHCLQRNPIATFEAMAHSDDIAYCPFAYGYSNYARRGYAPYQLKFGGLVELNGVRLRSTLGGTGFAISAQCKNLKAALEYSRFVASPFCQAGIYVQCGGQPAHRTAWLDEDANRLSNNYFRDTLQTLDEAYVRPRYNGYLHFQDEAGAVVHEFLRGQRDARNALQTIEIIFQDSLNQKISP